MLTKTICPGTTTELCPDCGSTLEDPRDYELVKVIAGSPVNLKRMWCSECGWIDTGREAA